MPADREFGDGLGIFLSLLPAATAAEAESGEPLPHAPMGFPVGGHGSKAPSDARSRFVRGGGPGGSRRGEFSTLAQNSALLGPGDATQALAARGLWTGPRRLIDDLDTFGSGENETLVGQIHIEFEVRERYRAIEAARRVLQANPDYDSGLVIKEV